MNKSVLMASLTLSLLSGSALAMEQVVLDGKHLTQDQAWAIADGAKVKIAPQAKTQLVKAHELLMEAARLGKPVYGLTVGVGLNKDHKLFDANGKLSDAVLDASRSFNFSTFRAHSAGVGDAASIRLTRLALAVRLNTMLAGQTGVQPVVAELYEAYLNKGLTPVIPAKGTVGEADILLSSHVGLAMVGEWEVFYKGQRVSSKEAMADAGIAPLVPMGKDALSILSNNAFAVAYAMQGYREAKQLLAVSPTVFGLSLEGLNGNVAPFLPQTNDIRPFPYIKTAASDILKQLDGSYLWQLNDERPLQDPLSFRTTAYTFAGAEQALASLDEVLNIQINHSDDNPAVIVGASNQYAQFPQVAKYLVEGQGGVFPTTNFEPLPVALAVQNLSVALTHVSHNSVMRTIHLSDEHFTKLTRFLSAPENQGHAFGAIQKAFVDMQVRNKQLATPVSFDGISIAGGIEDTFTNLKLASDNLIQIVDNTRVIYGLELLHSTQAIDLRKQANPELQLGKATQAMYKAYREKVPFVAKDRPFTPDIQASTDFITHY
ncbi:MULTISPECIES: HAL/PAL/TAL family ammonia-lyase [Shewanella]|uniref:HAL/PAL/TAL family ammonia-lyase n=1 Tax=Shewanella TaxID=22 RepID=UPI001CC365EA|nr:MULTISPECIES: aromatic amino acid ammonia-lyase [Shewanella]MDN5500542.1 aromatic amino acid lyase [Shewanella sp.]MDN5528681.1 aromatic amino acid lyase [Shewanella sp.]BDA60095.1 phenylalanine/histidine ammonia-lyase [Shewanella xiamenensis]